MEKQIECLVAACRDLGFRYTFIDEEKNFLCVEMPHGREYFQINKTPFNSEVVHGICKDKMHAYQLLNSVVTMPKTLSFLDCEVPEEYKKYLVCHSIKAMVNEIERSFDLPVVIKRNAGALGQNVYLCDCGGVVTTALRKIFNKNSKDYDYVALAQQFVPTQEEYRLVCAFGEPLLVYKRGNAKTFNVKYWQADELAVVIEEQALVNELYMFVRPVFSQIAIGFVGFDIIRGVNGQLYLIELNASPKFNHVIDSNGCECVIAAYRRAIELFGKVKSQSMAFNPKVA